MGNANKEKNGLLPPAKNTANKNTKNIRIRLVVSNRCFKVKNLVSENRKIIYTIKCANGKKPVIPSLYIQRCHYIRVFGMSFPK